MNGGKNFLAVKTSVVILRSFTCISDFSNFQQPYGIRSIRSQGRPAPSFYRMTRSHYKLHELCQTSDYSIYVLLSYVSSVLFFS